MANAGERDFTVPFPFIHQSHVTVTVNGGSADVLEWVNATTLRLASPLQAGDVVLISRSTPIDDQLVKFLDGAVLTAEDLNIAVEQLLYRQQELTDLYNGTIAAARQRILLANGVTTDAKDIANQIAAIAAESSLLADFRQRVSDIEAQGFTLAGHALSLDTLSAESIANANTVSGITTQVADLSDDLDGLRAVVDSLASLQDGTGIATVIQNEKDARIAGDTALAGTIALIGAKSGDNLSFILDLNKVKVSPTESFATRLSSLTAADAANVAALNAEATARANADSAEVTARTSLAATLRAETAALIASEQEARVTADTAEATARQTLAASVASNTAAITSEASTRATQDSVFAGLFTLLGAKSADGTAFVLDDAKVQLKNGTALATRLTGIDSAIVSSNASIASEITARTSADSALSTRIDTLSSTVGGNTASITTLQTTTNGLSAKYGVALDVNGYVTGFVQNNNGTSGSFTILADKFAIVTPGQAPSVPFEVVNGVTRIKEAVIGSLTVDRLTSGSLGANVTVNGEMRVGTGRIVWDNGTYMKVTGVGFGSANQFIEWFGPKMALISCTEANAIQYLKTDGSAYFGGTLSAGTLKNSGTGTATGPTAFVTIGPFGSNGRVRTVVLSYTFHSSATITTVCPVPGPVTATLKIYRGTSNAGTLLGTLNVTGSHQCDDGHGQFEPGSMSDDMGGSITVTDGSGGLQDISYYAEITSRASNTTQNIVQRISIVCTEQ